MGYIDPDQQREYQRKWRQARWKAWVDENGPCATCGSWIEPHVDHIDPSKKISHHIWSWRESRRTIELEKCHVLCRNCHEHKTGMENHLRHAGNLRKPIRHGLSYTYDRLKCRCDLCRVAKATRMKKYSKVKNVTSS